MYANVNMSLSTNMYIHINTNNRMRTNVNPGTSMGNVAYYVYYKYFIYMHMRVLIRTTARVPIQACQHSGVPLAVKRIWFP